MKRSNIAVLLLASLTIACGVDVTDPQAGYFDKGTDIDQHTDNSQTITTTYNIDQSQHNDNSTSITTVVDSVIVIRDTITVDSYDTVRVVVQDTVRDTVQHHIQVPIYDTITVLNADTLLLPVIDTIRRPITVKDTVRDTVFKNITLNAPKLDSTLDDHIVKFNDLSEIGLAVHFSKSTYSSWDTQIAIYDNDKTRKDDLNEAMYTVTYYGYNNNRYVIHYRTSGSLWQYVNTNNGCINIVEVHISNYGISGVGGYEYLWAAGSAIVCT